MKTWPFVLPLLFSILGLAAPAHKDPVYKSEEYSFHFEVLTQQDDVVWGFDFLDKEKILFSKRNGQLGILNLKTKEVSLVSGAPKVWAKGQGGLLDVRVSPQKGDQIFLTYSEPVSGGRATTALGTGILVKNELTKFRKIFSAHEPSDESSHFGSRIEFDQDHIFISVGDRQARPRVQDLSYHNGKTLRLNLDGSVPTNNPFVKTKDAKPEIWSYGHRNPQGLTRDPESGDLWLGEMGPKGGDELNLIEGGKNYGWPEVTYGREYSGFKIGAPEKGGTVPPVAHWVPSISPSGITVYKGTVFSQWQGNLFLATLSGTHLRRLVLKPQKKGQKNDQIVVKQEILLENLGQRFRNVRAGPDGYLYLSTDSGQIARLTPVGEVQ